jgi:predicted nucleotidyltransferase
MARKPAEFEAPLEAVLRLLENRRVPHVLIGGLAVSQLARPRLTADIDILIYLEHDDDIAGLLEAATRTGCPSRIEDSLDFARRHRMLLLVHQGSGIQIDISLGVLPFEREVIERSRVVHAGRLRLPLPTVEDLVILKAVAHRPVDLQDIRSLVERHPALDQRRVRTVVAEFAAALESPETLHDLLALLPPLQPR